MAGKSEASALSADEVRAEIARARAQISDSMVALRHEVSLRTNWRRWVHEHPGLCLTGAFVVGFWLGTRRRESRP
ncbi:MAG: hypothetical protein L0Y66_27165 [Myxococcaceae bacterium]|nr:hypothetical protein [Myxococcaceae bacterium]MCI0669878.1 hypothetical protein [Myxococcaceae bacterium]